MIWWYIYWVVSACRRHFKFGIWDWNRRGTFSNCGSKVRTCAIHDSSPFLKNKCSRTYFSLSLSLLFRDESTIKSEEEYSVYHLNFTIYIYSLHHQERVHVKNSSLRLNDLVSLGNRIGKIKGDGVIRPGV